MRYGLKVTINDDFKPGERGIIRGTAEVTINGVTKTLAASLSSRADAYHIPGVAVKYRTGKKIWSGSLTYWIASGNIAVHGGLDHHVRLNSVSLVGFYEDVRETVKSQHVGN